MTMTTTDGGIPIVPRTEALLASYADKACPAVGLMFLHDDPDVAHELGQPTSAAALVSVDLSTRPDLAGLFSEWRGPISVGTAVWRVTAVERDYEGVEDDLDMATVARPRPLKDRIDAHGSVGRTV
jgi:hypothetical protein